MELSPDAKERLGIVFEAVKTVFHWGFIPTVIYLGLYEREKSHFDSNPNLPNLHVLQVSEKAQKLGCLP